MTGKYIVWEGLGWRLVAALSLEKSAPWQVQEITVEGVLSFRVNRMIERKSLYYMPHRGGSVYDPDDVYWLDAALGATFREEVRRTGELPQLPEGPPLDPNAVY